MLTGSQRTHPWTTGSFFYPCFVACRAMALWWTPQKFTKPLDYFLCQWLQVKEVVMEVLKSSIHTDHTSHSHWNIMNFQKRHIPSNSLHSLPLPINLVLLSQLWFHLTLIVLQQMTLVHEIWYIMAYGSFVGPQDEVPLNTAGNYVLCFPQNKT